jgi:hypothetical protein
MAATEKVYNLALQTIERIAKATNAPSMGFDDGFDYHQNIVATVLIENPDVSEEELDEAISEIEHADDGPYGRIE